MSSPDPYAGNFTMAYDRDEGQDGNAEALLKQGTGDAE